MPGLTWLNGAPAFPGSLTFVRGTDERMVLTGLGVDPDQAIAPADPRFAATPGITLVRSGDWLVALEQTPWPRGIRPEVLSRLSAGTEAVALRQDIGQGDHELAHAADGEIITAVTTSAPPSWGGTQPGRLRPLAEELGLRSADGGPGPDTGLSDLEILLVLAETVFGLSLDQADLDHPLLKVPDQPDQPGDPAPRARRPAVMDSAVVRSHVRQLIDQGVSADTIAARAGMPVPWVARLLSDQLGPWMAAARAEQLLAIEAPSSP